MGGFIFVHIKRQKKKMQDINMRLMMCDSLDRAGSKEKTKPKDKFMPILGTLEGTILISR